MRNLRIAFPAWSEARRRRVLEESFANLGRGFVELATLGRHGPAGLRDLVAVEGAEHLEAALRQECGVVVLTAHLGNWEMLSALMASHGYGAVVVHRAREGAALDELLGEWRGRGGAELVPRGSAARTALRTLAGGRILAMPLDQNSPRDAGVFVSFFGRLASTRDAPLRLAMRTGAPVLPVFVERLDGSARHRVRIEPPLTLRGEQDGDRRAAVRENVRLASERVEAAIRRAPEQWTWTHRRWRTQPDGEPDPYPSRGDRRRRRLPGHPAAAPR
jgi:KDO2-lipid IV(A) lauroyltransferase